jgi:hypothetical protein
MVFLFERSGKRKGIERTVGLKELTSEIRLIIWKPSLRYLYLQLVKFLKSEILIKFRLNIQSYPSRWIRIVNNMVPDGLGIESQFRLPLIIFSYKKFNDKQFSFLFSEYRLIRLNVDSTTIRS